MKLVLVASGIARIVCHGNKPMFLVFDVLAGSVGFGFVVVFV